MKKKFKTAAYVLGALSLCMIMIITVLAFVLAGNVAKVEGNVGTDGGIADAAGDIATLAGAFLGHIGFILLMIIGFMFVIFTVCFAASYGKLYKDKNNPYFLRYSAIAFGIMTLFAITMCVIDAKSFYGLLIVFALTTALLSAYAAVVKKYYDLLKESNDFWTPEDVSEE